MRLSTRSGPRGALMLLAGVLLAACASWEQQEEVRKLQARSAYEQGLSNLQDRRVSLGLTALREAVRLDPDSAVYRNALGVLLLDLKRPVEAEAEFRRAAELDPPWAEAHHNLGLSLAEQGRWDEAIAAYRKALTMPIYPTPQVAYYSLGTAYLVNHRLKEAEEAFRTAIQLEPRLVSAHYNLGVTLSEAGRREEAKAAFRQARDLDPSSPFVPLAVQALKKLEEGG